jgi:hypothetical protein
MRERVKRFDQLRIDQLAIRFARFFNIPIGKRIRIDGSDLKASAGEVNPQ